MNLREFANGEIHCRYESSIRGCDVFIVQTHCHPVNDALMEQLIMIDAAKRASAKRITAVCPYYGYSRQDRKSTGREPITAKLVADMLSVAGAERVVSVDLHSGQVQGFFDVPFDHLTAAPVLENYLRDAGGRRPGRGRARCRPGKGGRALQPAPQRGPRPRSQAPTPGHGQSGRGPPGRRRSRGAALCADRRHHRHGRHDLRSGRSTRRGRGAADVWAMATHPVLSDSAVDRLKAAAISRVIVTDTLPVPSDRTFDKLEVLSTSKIIADAIDAVFEDSSVSEIFGGENLA